DIDAGADDETVTRILEQVTADLQADPQWKEPILAPADISGILDVDGNRYQRRVVVQTVPGQQWGVERELRARIRAGFASAHVAFAMPRFVVAGKLPPPAPVETEHDHAHPYRQLARVGELLRRRRRCADLRPARRAVLRGRRR